MIQDIPSIDARKIGSAFALDRDLRLPLRPKWIPELLLIPFGLDKLVVSGTDQLEILGGKSARRLLPNILPLLNGLHTIEEIARMYPSLRSKTLYDVVSLLFSRGLLEDGIDVTLESTNRLEDMESFLGRFVDATRCNRNRQEAMGRLSHASVLLLGDQALAESLLHQLRLSGITLAMLPGTDVQFDEYDLSVVLSSGTSCISDEMVELAFRKSKLTMLIRLGEQEAQIGPVLRSRMSCCVDCFLRIFRHPAGSPSDPLAAYWTALAGQSIVNMLAELAPNRGRRDFRVYRINDHGEMSHESFVPVRTPGCSACGISHSPLSFTDERLLAWIYHCSTSLPSRSLISPKDHQNHYKVANLQLAKEEKHSFGNVPVINLPTQSLAAKSIFTGFLSSDHRDESSININHLSTILWAAGGETLENDKQRRVAPTGGNLGSVDLWVVVNRMNDVRRGIYRYQAAYNCLEVVRYFTDDTDFGLHSFACLIVGTGNLAKCAQKYNDFSYRLCQYDAGIALAHLHAASENLGLPATEQIHLDDEAIADLLQIPRRWEFPLPTFMVAFGPHSFLQMTDINVSYRDNDSSKNKISPVMASLGQKDFSSKDLLWRIVRGSATLSTDTYDTSRRSFEIDPALVQLGSDSLGAALKSRRAVREFSSRPVSEAHLILLVQTAIASAQVRVERGAPPCFVRPVLAVARGNDNLEPGVYELDPNKRLRKRANFDETWMQCCFNQKTFGTARAAIFTIADLGQALQVRGLRGYQEACQHSGSMIGTVWLAASSLGIVGSAAGGVLADGLREVANVDGFQECPLLAFPMGHKETSHLGRT